MGNTNLLPSKEVYETEGRVFEYGVGYKNLKGISIFVSSGENELFVLKETGFIDALTKAEDGDVTITVVKDPGVTFIPFRVDGTKNPHKLKTKILEGKEVFSFTVPIKISNSERNAGINHVERIENTFRFLYDDGISVIKMGEISLLSLHGSFFLWNHTNYNLRCFKREGTPIYCPELQTRRPQYIKLLNDIPGIKERNLPKYEGEVSPFWNPNHERSQEKFRALIETIGRKGGENSGVCAWFTPAQLTGAIFTPQKGLVALHWTNIIGNEKPEEGEIFKKFVSIPNEALVTFKNIIPKVNTKAKKSGFEFQAMGVEALK